MTRACRSHEPPTHPAKGALKRSRGGYVLDVEAAGLRARHPVNHRRSGTGHRRGVASPCRSDRARRRHRVGPSPACGGSLEGRHRRHPTRRSRRGMSSPSPTRCERFLESRSNNWVDPARSRRSRSADCASRTRPFSSMAFAFEMRHPPRATRPPSSASCTWPTWIASRYFAAQGRRCTGRTRSAAP